LSVVLLPAPFGPSRPKHSPRCTVNDNPSTAVASPKRLTSVRTSSTVCAESGASICMPVGRSSELWRDVRHSTLSSATLSRRSLKTNGRHARSGTTPVVYPRAAGRFALKRPTSRRQPLRRSQDGPSVRPAPSVHCHRRENQTSGCAGNRRCGLRSAGQVR